MCIKKHKKLIFLTEGIAFTESELCTKSSGVTAYSEKSILAQSGPFSHSLSQMVGVNTLYCVTNVRELHKMPKYLKFQVRPRDLKVQNRSRDPKVQ